MVLARYLPSKLFFIILKTEIFAKAKLTPTILNQIFKNQNASTIGNAMQLTVINANEKINAFLFPVLAIRLTKSKDTIAIGISLKDSKTPKPLYEIFSDN
ncbi:hypothetical protein GCM10007332_29310 [Epilithonimonas arachidiradicis]|uniref:Uncharacterized protein n=1 Tax=Epilithonimonas arachidiradicis TaxID=1617282 RepID=A0ABQ1XAK8_9FLAO|nr:hypothetical protein GCM10007332_29310 [Epilithonimonas arachidiradicis]